MAYLFGSGVTDKIVCGAADAVTKSTNRTMVAWVKRADSDATDHHIFNVRDPAAATQNHAYMAIGAANSMDTGFYGSGGWRSAKWTSADTDDTAWHLVICDYDGSDLHVYSDQDLTAKQTTTGTWVPDTNTGQEAWIGNNPAAAENTESFDGHIAEVAWFTRVLTATERAGLGAGASPLFFNPDNYWPLISDARDWTGGVDGTVTGATVSNHPPGLIYPSSPIIIPSAAAAAAADFEASARFQAASSFGYHVL